MRNKTMHRLLSLLLLLTMVFAFSSCTQPPADNGPAVTEPADTPAETPDADPAGTPSDAPAEEAPPAEDTDPAEVPAETAYFPRPDGTSMSIWYTAPGYAGLENDWNACPGYMALEDLTNVTIDWTTASLNAAAEMFNIMIVSQDYTDIMQGFSTNYLRGIDNAVEEEIILDLKELIPRYMPVYEGMIQADPDLVRRTTTDSGVRGAVYCIYTVPQMPWSGLVIRQDWLEELDLESPRTYDQLHEVLVAFRDEMGATAPLSLGMIGDSCWMGGWNVGHAFAGGFGGPNCMMQKDGAVTYGPLEPGYKEYLETFSQWYSEGLIDRDFAGNGMEYIVSDLVYKDQTGVWWGIGQGDHTANPAAADPDFHGVGIQNFIRDEAQGTSHFCVDSSPIGIGSSVSTACEDVELALRWMDFCYGEGAVALNFGYEGEQFYFDENGEPTMDAEKMMAYFGEDTYGPIRQATGPVEAPYLRYMDRGLPVKKSSIPNSEESVNVAWKYDDNDWAIPSNISMTVEESEEYNAIFTDIQTQVMEYTVKIIMGEYDMSKYDELMGLLEAQNIGRAVEIMQGVVDRYYARGTN